MSDDPAALRRGPPSLVGMTEKELRKHGRLAPDDSLVEWRQGRLLTIRVDGVPQPLPRPSKLVRWPRGLAQSAYSSRSLFFGSQALMGDLAFLWLIKAEGDDLFVIYTFHKFVAVRWRCMEADPAVDLGGLVTRVREQAERRAQELEPEWRERLSAIRQEVNVRGLVQRELAVLASGTST